MKYKLKTRQKSTLPKSSSESKNLKQESRRSKQLLTNSQTSFKPTASELWETAKTNAPKTVKVDDLLTPTMGPVKRGRGRPKKENASGSFIKPDTTQAYSTTGITDAPSTITNVATTSLPIPTAALKPILNGPFFIMSVWLDDQECQLTDQELEQLAPAADAVAKQYSSAMNSPHAPLYILVGSMLAIAAGKYAGHKKRAPEKEMEKEKLKAEPPKAGDANNPFMTEVIQ